MYTTHLNLRHETHGENDASAPSRLG